MTYLCNISVMTDRDVASDLAKSFFDSLPVDDPKVVSAHLLAIEHMHGVPDQGDMENHLLQLEFKTKTACMEWVTESLDGPLFAFNNAQSPRAMAFATVLSKKNYEK